MLTYIALIRKERNSGFGVDFPDFPGCITMGNTLEEAYSKASEALRFHIKGMLADGESISEPSHLTDILENPENAGATPFLVTISNVKTKRINVTMPESDLEEIDACARKRKMSRSAFLLDAAKRSMLSDARVE